MTDIKLELDSDLDLDAMTEQEKLDHIKRQTAKRKRIEDKRAFL